MSQTEARDLIVSALTDLKLTTITYQQWQANLQAGKYPNPSLTKWGSAFSKLSKAQAALSPAPVITGELGVGETLTAVVG